MNSYVFGEGLDPLDQEYAAALINSQLDASERLLDGSSDEYIDAELDVGVLPDGDTRRLPSGN